MNPAEFDFETLKAASAGGGSWVSTFAYWLGVLFDPSAKFAREAKYACEAMSCQFDIEEQATELDSLRAYPKIIPSIFHPVAPVTLALRWSPFPAALTALGPPIYTNRGDFATALAVFRPVEAPTFPATTPDELHFQFLLRHACERAIRCKRWVLLAGSPGWSYNSEDFITGNPDLQQLMADFGFVFFARKPAN